MAPAISEEVQRKSEGGSRPGKPSGLAALEFDSARVARGETRRDVMAFKVTFEWRLGTQLRLNPHPHSHRPNLPHAAPPHPVPACIFGGGIHAPIAHVHYNFLESLTVRVNALKWGAYGPTVFKTIMEQFVYWSWFSNALYHAAMGAMQGYTLEMVGRTRSHGHNHNHNHTAVTLTIGNTRYLTLTYR